MAKWKNMLERLKWCLRALKRTVRQLRQTGLALHLMPIYEARIEDLHERIVAAKRGVHVKPQGDREIAVIRARVKVREVHRQIHALRKKKNTKFVKAAMKDLERQLVGRMAGLHSAKTVPQIYCDYEEE